MNLSKQNPPNIHQPSKDTAMKTVNQVRAAFWEAHPQFKADYRKTYRQNQYNATIRTHFVDYVDHLRRNGDITESLAHRVTL
jgi:hypothetical protein